MHAFKFMRPGGVGPFSGVRWPVDGTWVRGDAGSPALCRTAVHACDERHLPFWMAEELWEVELDGPVEERRSKLVAPAGRLVDRVERWDFEMALAFMDATVERIRRYDADGAGGYMTEAGIFCVGAAGEEDPFGNAALSTMIAVEAAEALGGHALVKIEREAQADWLADRLGLQPALS